MISQAVRAEGSDWRFCTIGAMGSDRVYISEPFRDGRLSQSLEREVENAVQAIGIIDRVVQCRQPTAFMETAAARNRAVDVNRQLGTKVINIELGTKAPTARQTEASSP